MQNRMFSIMFDSQAKIYLDNLDKLRSHRDLSTMTHVRGHIDFSDVLSLNEHLNGLTARAIG